MSDVKPGERVGAILSMKGKDVLLLGFGVYEGNEIPPEDVGGIAAMLRFMARTNPKIRLDNGKIVWGCECWWGSEEQMKKELVGKIVTMVNMDDYKKQLAEAANDDDPEED